MVEFTHKDLQGSRFEDVHLGGSRFDNVHLGDARFQNVWLGGARLSGVGLVDVEINGEIDNVRINGVDVGPLVEAELNRRHPERVRMRPQDADGFREAWEILERLWAETVDRARAMAPALLHERVDGQWSFIETLRHLVFATDAWVYRAFLGEPAPWDPLDLPHDDMEDAPGVPRDRPCGRRSTRCWRCGPTGWAPCVGCSPTSPTSSWPGRPSRSPEPGYPESESFPVTPLPAGGRQRGVGAPALRRARPGGAQHQVDRMCPLSAKTAPAPSGMAAARRGSWSRWSWGRTLCGRRDFPGPRGRARTVGSNEAPGAPNQLRAPARIYLLVRRSTSGWGPAGATQRIGPTLVHRGRVLLGLKR